MRRGVGRIGDRMHVFHPFMISRYAAVGLEEPEGDVIRSAVCTARPIATAALCRHVFELPINRIEARFPYDVRKADPG